MKIIISERQQKLIKENSMRDSLIRMIKDDGWNDTAELVGSIWNLRKMSGIDTPIEFLHLYDDLDVVESKERPGFTLFRYEPKKNIIIYDEENNKVYLNYDKIWSVLKEVFHKDKQQSKYLIQKWLSESYDLTTIIVTKDFGEHLYGIL
jgi:hypothetical protein